MASPSFDPPTTLDEWRRKGAPSMKLKLFPRYMWIPLEPFFLSIGYTLWKKSGDVTTVPPNDAPRKLDEYACRIPYNDLSPHVYEFHMVTSIHCPARTSDNRDVLIRLMAIGEDRGTRHRDALSHLTAGDNASRRDNHVIPVLDKIEHNDMLFYVFPLLSGNFSHPWFLTFAEVLDAMDQVLEGIRFCHDNLVAHLDIDDDNILVNWIGGHNQPRDPVALDLRLVMPFRSVFPVPIRYYLNDFEFAVAFDPESDPASRKVIGLPIDGLRTGDYGRDVAPEMLTKEPYCPFRADVWQMGSMFKYYFGHLGDLCQPMVDLIRDMAAEEPLARPLARDALEHFREIRTTCSSATLAAAVPWFKPRSIVIMRPVQETGG